MRAFSVWPTSCGPKAIKVTGPPGKLCWYGQPHPIDRLRNVVAITETGMARLKELDQLLAIAQQTVLDPLTQAERGILERLLSKLA